MRGFAKNVISAILTITIIIGTAAIADFDWLNIKSYADGTPSGGKCGDEAYFTFDGRKLVIGGKGKMYDYFFVDPEGFEPSNKENFPPWFLWRNEINEVEIGNGIQSIGSCAFSHCDYLETVNVPYYSTEVIERNAFDSCKNLKKVKFSNGLKEIGSWAFMGCTSLESIEFPASLKSVDRSAFESCGIKEITIPETLEILGRNAFTDCINLENVIFPNNTEIINRGVFSRCTKLKKIDLPEYINSIGREAFYGCTGLEEICIPDSVESIGMAAFCDCTNLNSIRMSKNVTYIDEVAFDNTGYYNNKSNWENGALYIDEYLIKANNVSENYYIKTGTRSVARHAFECSDSLTSVIVPASVNSFSYNPFYECNNLNKVVFMGRNVEFNDVFSSNETELTFYCFSDSDAYNYAQEKGIKCVSLDGLKTGDASGDKVINSTDALKVLQFAVGQNTEINEFYPAMDVNIDESVNSSDALAILQYSVGIIDRFKCSSVNSVDEDILCDTMGHILWYKGDFYPQNKCKAEEGHNYNCNQKDAFETAFDCMLSQSYYSLVERLSDIYGWGGYSQEIYSKNLPDPRRVFSYGGYYEYNQYNGEKFDNILECIFNVKPTHSFVAKDNDGNMKAYYDNGFYYAYAGDGGDGEGPGARFNSMRAAQDGKYVINITYQRCTIDGDYDLADYNITAELINLNGDRVWSLYSFEKAV